MGSGAKIQKSYKDILGLKQSSMNELCAGGDPQHFSKKHLPRGMQHQRSES